jgi:hypothetical protein
MKGIRCLVLCAMLVVACDDCVPVIADRLLTAQYPDEFHSVRTDIQDLRDVKQIQAVIAACIARARRSSDYESFRELDAVIDSALVAMAGVPGEAAVIALLEGACTADAGIAHKLLLAIESRGEVGIATLRLRRERSTSSRERALIDELVTGR